MKVRISNYLEVLITNTINEKANKLAILLWQNYVCSNNSNIFDENILKIKKNNRYIAVMVTFGYRYTGFAI